MRTAARRSKLRSLLMLLPALWLTVEGCAAPSSGHGASDLPELDFDLLFSAEAGGRRPTSFAWSPDGSRLAYYFNDGSGKGLWVTEPGGQPVLLEREGESGLDKLGGFLWAPKGDSILVDSSGDLVLLSTGAETRRQLTRTDAAEEDPQFSPDGRALAFVRENDLWLYDFEAGAERRLTHDGEDGLILNGKTDWVYWEEIWGRRQTGHWFSPDGSRIAYYRFDQTPVRKYPLVDFTTQYPEVAWQRYPKAGEDNARVSVGILDLESSETVWLLSNSSDDSYLSRVDWHPDGESVAIQRLNRDQNFLELLNCPADGSDCHTLLEERADTWVNLTKDLRFLPDGRFLWTTESAGWRKLWLHGKDGTPEREMTPGTWTVDHVDGVTDNGYVVWTGYETGRLGAIHRTVFSQGLGSGEPVALSSRDKTARATASRASGSAAIVESTANQPPVAYVVDVAGNRLAELPTSAPRGFDPADLPQWKFLTLPGPDGIQLPAALLEPQEPPQNGSRLPVIQYHYGGPASQVVRDSWGSRGRGLWHKLMATRGYGVLMVDNAGSNFFGKRGADRLHRRFGEVNLAAQKAGVTYLSTLDWADARRVGLWGWSGGGSNTLYSLLNSPGTWRAGVSGAPVTNWRLYDTIWTERYLDHPSDNPEGYEDSSATEHAAKLEDELLIVHGTADDNVHPQNTFAMAAALVAAGRPFEMAIHPRQKHGLRGKDSRHFYERMTRFFDRALSD